MLIALLMPVVQILLFGFAISTEVNNVNVAVVVPKWSEEIRNAVEKLSANPYITYKGAIGEHEVDRYLRSGEADTTTLFCNGNRKPPVNQQCNSSWMLPTPMWPKPEPAT